MRSAVVLSVLAACGEVSHKPDAQEVFDASPDAPPAPVKVTVLTYMGDGLPDLTARIVAQDPAGLLLFDAPPDANGQAEIMMPTGGSVTTVRTLTDTPTQLQMANTTITGVKPGDDLTIGRKALATNINGGGATTMSASYFPAPGADGHQFFTACGTSFGGTTTPVTLNFRDSCHGATFDLLAVATVPGQTPRFVKLTGVNYQSGGTFSIPNGFQAMSNFSITAQNVPAEITTLTATRSSMIENQAVAPQTVAFGDPPPGTSTVAVPFAPGFGTRSEVVISTARTDATGAQRHDAHTATLANSFDIDLSAHRLPWITSAVSTATGATWTVVAPGDAPDGLLLQWSGRWSTDGVKQTNVAWRVYRASDASPTGFTLPALPGQYAFADPSQQTVPVTPQTSLVFIVDYDNFTSYDEFRQAPDTFIEVAPDDMGALIGMPFQRHIYQAVFGP